MRDYSSITHHHNTYEVSTGSTILCEHGFKAAPTHLEGKATLSSSPPSHASATSLPLPPWSSIKWHWGPLECPLPAVPWGSFLAACKAQEARQGVHLEREDRPFPPAPPLTCLVLEHSLFPAAVWQRGPIIRCRPSGWEQPGLVEGVPARSRGSEREELEPTQPKAFQGSVILWILCSLPPWPPAVVRPPSTTLSTENTFP